jgi:electron transfer flavoprotein alpha subunit
MEVAIVLSRHNSRKEARMLISAAKTLGEGKISLWYFSNSIEGMNKLPVDDIIWMPISEDFLPYQLLPALKERYDEFSPDVLIFAGDYTGNNLAVELSYYIDGTYIKGVTGIKCFSDGHIFTKRVYGLHLESQREYNSPPYLLSIAKDSFEEIRGDGLPNIKKIKNTTFKASRNRKFIIHKKEKDRDLADFEVVLIGGRGIGSKNNAKSLVYLAKLMGAGVGATRPAIYNGWFDLSCLVGASGKSVSPKLCMVFGASGCMPLLLGIKKSQKIIAVNIDPYAPIFDNCDVGLVDDCNKVIKSLIERFESCGSNWSELVHKDFKVK